MPESPRWLLIHGREREAEEIVDGIEREVLASIPDHQLAEPETTIRIRQRKFFGIPAARAPIDIIPFAAGNFLGPLLLGRLFDDELGRRTLRREWGPGRFNRALRAAIVQGRVRRSGRGRYKPVVRPSSSSLQPEK